MKIIIDDLSGPVIAAFLEEHIQEMKAVTPVKSKHALDLNGLRKPEITFWTVWDGDTLVGCGAIKELDKMHAEVKSMRTSSRLRRIGIASRLLQHIIDEAKRRQYHRLSLETGAFEFFEPARKLYAKHGFTPCGPFGSYKPDPNSCFMTLELKLGVMQ